MRSQRSLSRRPTGGGPFRCRTGHSKGSEGVPVRHRKAKVIGHRPAIDDFRGIVVLEGQRILGEWAFVEDLADFWKCGLHKFSV